MIGLERYKMNLFLIIGMLVCSVSLAHAQTSSSSLALIPYPAHLTESEGTFTFSDATTIAIEENADEVLVENFASLFIQSAGFSPKVKTNSKKGDICVVRDKDMPEEAYRMEITSKKIIITSSSTKGTFYALQTLRQLLPAAIEGEKKAKNAVWSVPAMSISDEPRFGYRGLMVDVARTFLPKKELMKIIECMGMMKLNRLQLHLTDDNGWRLEIKKYPLLTEIGSRRVNRSGIPFPDRRNARQGEPTEEGGYYTQDDIREIVAYAAERQIEVIPEIAIPGHSQAALAAYPLLTCPVVDKYIGVVPGLGSNHSDIVFCAGNEEVYTFLQDIIDEVVELFPSSYIHLGGDALPHTHWEECPLCRERMEKEDLDDEKDLLGYFFRRLDRYAHGKGRQTMGWQEIMEANLSKGAVVFDWHGYGHGAMEAGKQRHQFVLTPTDILYLNRSQGPQWFEPMAFEGMNTLEEIYHYEPIERYWTMSMRSLFLGMQASMWTEFCESAEDVEYLLFPRLAAVAEAAWSVPVAKRWTRFLPTLDKYAERWTLKGIHYAGSIYNIQHEVVPDFGALKVSLNCMRPDVEIRYTLNGKEPTAHSSVYRRPIQVKETQTVKCATFRQGKQMGKTLTLPVVMVENTGKNLLRSNAVERRIVNGVRGSLMYTDNEWAFWTNNDSIALTLDMGGRKKMKHITLGCLNDFGMGIHKPASIEIQLSNNDVSYWKIAEKQFTPSEIFKEGRSVEDLLLEIDDRARYVRIILKGVGKCPNTHVRSGQEVRVMMDEVTIEVEAMEEKKK